MSTGTTTEAVKERPVIFGAEDVRAIIDGRKTQFRRVIRVPEWFEGHTISANVYPWRGDELGFGGEPLGNHQIICARDGGEQRFCPYGLPGQRLWVRETWCPRSGGMLAMDRICKPRYRADGELRPEWGFRWRSPIQMPRWASRLTLVITGVRVERLTDISETDCYCEGRPLDLEMDPVSRPGAAWFRERWDARNGAGSYDSAPWVWCVAFKPVPAPAAEGGGR